MNPHRGMTLIELLVVIAIIGILLAILIPSLKKARKKIQAVICRSNLTQWGISLGSMPRLTRKSSPRASPVAGQKINLKALGRLKGARYSKRPVGSRAGRTNPNLCYFVFHWSKL